MLEPGAEPEPGQVVVGQARQELPLLGFRVQLHPGGEQQLTTGQPRGRVQELGDVHPSHRQVQPAVSREQANVQIAQQVPDGQH